MNTTNVEKLIRFILAEASQSEEWQFRELGPIHLIKYVYLADLYYAARHDGETYTGIEWQFYHLGPWSAALYADLPRATEAVGANLKTFTSQYSKDGQRWSLNHDYLDDHDYDNAAAALPFEITRQLRLIVRKFGQSTYDLLHLVYTTPPMLHAAPNELLDFSHAVEPNEEALGKQYSQAQKLTTKTKKKLKQKKLAFRERLLARKEERKKRLITPHPPNYDEVFLDGTIALDELASSPFDEKKCVLKIDDSVWKTSWRHCADLS